MNETRKQLETEIDVLEDAKARILDPAKLCRNGNYACDADGIIVGVDDERACKWCALGSLYLSCRGVGTAMRMLCDNLLYTAAWEVHEDRGVVGINDRQGHAAVMRLYDRAIEIAKERRTKPVDPQPTATVDSVA